MSSYPTPDNHPEGRSESAVATPKWGPLMTAREVGDYLRCDVSTVYDLVHRGRLRAISLTGNMDPHKRGKKGLRVLASSVDELITVELAGQKSDVPAAPAEPEPVVMPSREPVRRSPRAARSRVMLPRPGQAC